MGQTSRNAAIFSKKRKSPEEIVTSAGNVINEFVSYQSQNKEPGRLMVAKWHPPAKGVSKMNFDAACSTGRDFLA
ncbi:hypothetical protein U1Q18_004091 [Sarracenia purpurea var. burkii]